MNFRCDNQEVAIDISKNGDMVIMTADGNQIIRQLQRVRLERIAKDVMTISGVEELSFGKFSYRELYLFNVKEPSP